MEITENTSQDNGAGLFLTLSSDISLSNSQISNNLGQKYGGGVHIDESKNINI